MPAGGGAGSRHGGFCAGETGTGRRCQPVFTLLKLHRMTESPLLFCTACHLCKQRNFEEIFPFPIFVIHPATQQLVVRCRVPPSLLVLQRMLSQGSQAASCEAEPMLIVHVHPAESDICLAKAFSTQGPTHPSHQQIFSACQAAESKGRKHTVPRQRFIFV